MSLSNPTLGITPTMKIRVIQEGFDGTMSEQRLMDLQDSPAFAPWLIGTKDFQIVSQSRSTKKYQNPHPYKRPEGDYGWGFPDFFGDLRLEDDYEIFWK